MRKWMIAAALLAASFSDSQAQGVELSYGLKGGYGRSTMRAPRRADITNVSGYYTFNSEFYLDIAFTEHFSIQPGLGVTGRGAKINVLQEEASTTTTFYKYQSNPIYLELPVNFIAKIPIGDIFDKCNVILGGGPYVAYGIAGKQKVSGKFLGKSFSSEDNITFSNDDQPVNSNNFYGEFKKFDFGLNAIAGLEYHWLTLNVGYAYGAVNINPGANLSPIDRVKNRSWYASVGVKF
ncbi:MAG: porin family protein [Chitinophagaceae bacterium]